MISIKILCQFLFSFQCPWILHKLPAGKSFQVYAYRSCYWMWAIFLEQWINIWSRVLTRNFWSFLSHKVQAGTPRVRGGITLVGSNAISTSHPWALPIFYVPFLSILLLRVSTNHVLCHSFLYSRIRFCPVLPNIDNSLCPSFASSQGTAIHWFCCKSRNYRADPRISCCT